VYVPYCEGMPLKSGNDRNIDENIISGFKCEMGRPSDDQTDHFGGQDHTHSDPSFAFFTQTPCHSEDFFNQKYSTGSNKPFPEIGGMKYEQDPIDNIEQMAEVKHLKKKRIQ
jgi:hypothetical protein